MSICVGRSRSRRICEGSVNERSETSARFVCVQRSAYWSRVLAYELCKKIHLHCLNINISTERRFPYEAIAKRECYSNRNKIKSDENANINITNYERFIRKRLLLYNKFDLSKIISVKG